MRISNLNVILAFVFLILMPIMNAVNGFETAVIFGILSVFNLVMAVYVRIGENENHL